MSNNKPMEQLMISEATNSSSSVPTRCRTIQVTQVRKQLLALLSIMFTFSFVYLIFLGFSCTRYFYSWLCEYFNHSYELGWACISLIFDGFWILIAYQYYAKGLLIFAWLSAMFLLIFAVLLVLALLTFCRVIMLVDRTGMTILVISFISMLGCTFTLILQIVTILFSLKLSKLITRFNPPNTA